jgi:hypothetical protein
MRRVSKFTVRPGRPEAASSGHDDVRRPTARMDGAPSVEISAHIARPSGVATAAVGCAEHREAQRGAAKESAVPGLRWCCASLRSAQPTRAVGTDADTKCRGDDPVKPEGVAAVAAPQRLIRPTPGTSISMMATPTTTIRPTTITFGLCVAEREPAGNSHGR